MVHQTYFESRTGRKLRLDATSPIQIVLEVENQGLTSEMMKQVERIMGLRHLHSPRLHNAWPRPRLARGPEIHREGMSNLPCRLSNWHSEPSGGRTIIEKLDAESRHCSYAVVIMTGEDTADDEVRARGERNPRNRFLPGPLWSRPSLPPPRRRSQHSHQPRRRRLLSLPEGAHFGCTHRPAARAPDRFPKLTTRLPSTPRSEHPPPPF